MTPTTGKSTCLGLVRSASITTKQVTMDDVVLLTMGDSACCFSSCYGCCLFSSLYMVFSKIMRNTMMHRSEDVGCLGPQKRLLQIPGTRETNAGLRGLKRKPSRLWARLLVLAASLNAARATDVRIMERSSSSSWS